MALCGVLSSASRLLLVVCTAGKRIPKTQLLLRPLLPGYSNIHSSSSSILQQQHTTRPHGRSRSRLDFSMEDEEFVESAERMGNLSLRGKGGKGRGGGRGGRGGGKGGRGGGGGDRKSQISRALSQLLRHQAENAGIRLDAEGYAPLDKVVSIFHPILFIFVLGG